VSTLSNKLRAFIRGLGSHAQSDGGPSVKPQVPSEAEGLRMIFDLGIHRFHRDRALIGLPVVRKGRWALT